MKEFTERLKELRKAHQLRQKDLAKDLEVARTTIANYEQGTRFPDKETLLALANYFAVSTDYLLGRSDYPKYLPPGTLPARQIQRVPILNTLDLGKDLWHEEHLEGYYSLEKKNLAPGQYFFLRIKEDSMLGSRIYPGDLVLIKEQSSLESGQIALIVINNQISLKRVYYKEEQLILQPDNPKYEPLIASREDVQILGKAIRVEFNL